MAQVIRYCYAPTIAVPYSLDDSMKKSIKQPRNTKGQYDTLVDRPTIGGQIIGFITVVGIGVMFAITLYAMGEAIIKAIV